MLAVGLIRIGATTDPSERILRQAATLAHRGPILAEPIEAEQLALDGRRIWIGNPLDAFARSERLAFSSAASVIVSGASMR